MWVSARSDAAQQKAGDYAEMNFDLDKCLPIEPNLYRCPQSTSQYAPLSFHGPISNVYVSARKAMSSCSGSVGSG